MILIMILTLILFVFEIEGCSGFVRLTCRLAREPELRVKKIVLEICTALYLILRGVYFRSCVSKYKKGCRFVPQYNSL